MSFETVSTAAAPRAIGPLQSSDRRQRAGKDGLLLRSDSLDAATGEFVGAGDVRQQTETVMKNLGAVLSAAGASFAAVVKTTIYLTDLQDFAAVNEIYGRHFPDRPPARATVQVAALPKAALVEIDAIAVIDG